MIAAATLVSLVWFKIAVQYFLQLSPDFVKPFCDAAR
jgi:hypothetical protein